MQQSYTEVQLLFIAEQRMAGSSWAEATEAYNKKFKDDKTSDAIRFAWNRYKDALNLTDKEVDLLTLKELARVKKNTSRVTKVNKKILDQLVAEQDILEHMRGVVEELNKRPAVKVKKYPSKKRKSMTIEAMLSDIHFGKKTHTFNLEVCRNRLRHYTATLLREVSDNQVRFNVDRIIVALLGDIIESATMHGNESAKGCEFGNAKQVQEAVRSIFEDVLVPLAQTGIKMDVVCVTGNHDRTERDRTYNNPGEENLTWIIYNTLDMLCKQAGFKHIKFTIPVNPYATLEIYGKHCLYEHYDNAKSNSREALERLMMKRQKQLGRVISFMRGGHFHEATMYGRGTIIVNGSVPGQDSFADVLGFDSEATQTINYYIETVHRPTPFYQSFPVYLP